MRRDNVRPLGAATPAPAQRVIEEAAAMLAKAEYPLIVTAALGRSAEAVSALGELAQEFAHSGRASHSRPISTCRPTTRCISASKPARISRRPTSFSSSIPACRGCRRWPSRRRAPRSFTCRSTRWSAVTRSANTRPICWSPAIRLKVSRCCVRHWLARPRRRTVRSIRAARHSPLRATTCSPSAKSSRSR